MAVHSVITLLNDHINFQQGILKSILNSWCKQDFAVMIVHVESEILALQFEL